MKSSLAYLQYKNPSWSPQSAYISLIFLSIAD